jgi:hypothetical protein
MSGKFEKGEASAPAIDWLLSDEDQAWIDVLEALEEGHRPDDQALARLLRTSKYEVHQHVRNYLADRLEGKVKPRRGRPPKDAFEQIRKQFVVWSTYQSVLRDVLSRHKSQRHGTPREMAFEEASERLLAERNIKISPGEVRRRMYPPRQTPRRRKCSK